MVVCFDSTLVIGNFLSQTKSDLLRLRQYLWKPCTYIGHLDGMCVCVCNAGRIPATSHTPELVGTLSLQLLDLWLEAVQLRVQAFGGHF